MNITLRELLDLSRVQALLNSLNRTNPFPTAIIDNDGNILTASGWQKVCTRFHRVNPDTERDCQKSDRCIRSRLEKAGIGPSVTYRCPRGLIDSATPIFIDGKHLGSVFTGQVFVDKPDMEFFTAQAKRYGFDEHAYLEAVAKVPVLTGQKLEEIFNSSGTSPSFSRK